MTSVGSGYDSSSTIFSPDGRVFQVEYAHKAVDLSGTSIGVRCKDGVVFASEKLIPYKMLVPGSGRRIASVDRHVGMVVSGLAPDGRQLVNRARSEAAQYKSFYGNACPVKQLASRMGNFMQMYTIYGHVRPFGAAAILGGVDADGPCLYMVEPSGISVGYFGVAIGKGKQAAKTDLEKLKLSEMTCREAAKAVAKIIHTVHDDVKDKAFELELSWVCPESNNQHAMLPTALRDEIEATVKSEIEAEDMDDE